ncbi:TPA: hypothetical protein ACPSKZ_000683 [Legionella anisa]|uniref:hypothetical protein n=1 Tax=Legionella anisa TaxID=28082 RepID=UPI00224379CB|nr:hypothetical protein [Legionella anisa]MCW8425619.1 hypothetical protein [Legionella anisa]MCW8448952.1 hypothetical protein [Legionella anisa]
MARDLDNFPTYDPIIRDGIYLSNIWADFMATFIETLSGYLSQNGIFIPRLTNEQRNALQNVVNGQVIYNTTVNKFQGYENGAWGNFI